MNGLSWATGCNEFMTYESKRTIESAALPGVRFTLKKINVKRRLSYNLSMASKFEEARTMYKAAKPLEDEYQAALKDARLAAKPEIEALMASDGITREEAAKRVPHKLTFDADKLEALLLARQKQSEYDARELTPAMVRFFVLSVDGLEIDGAPATVDSVIEDGQDELYREMIDAVSAELGLSVAERENLQSPIPSEPPVDGIGISAPVASSTTATTAESAATT